MVASAYVPSAEFPTYAEYRLAKLREYRRAWKKAHPEQVRHAANARQRERYASDPEYAKKRIELSTAAYASSPEKQKARSASRRALLSKTPEFIAYEKAYRAANKPAAQAYKKLWMKKNAASINQRNAARRALCKLATPKWADKQAMNDVYAEAKHMQMHVDHAIPLNHPLVCGLHVWENLQLLTPEDNLRKNNRFDPEVSYAC